MDTEAYQNGHFGDFQGYSLKIPPWLKVLEYTNHSIGVCAVVPMASLFDRTILKKEPLLVKTYGILNLLMCDEDRTFQYFTDLTRKQTYLLFKKSKTNITFVSGAYLQDQTGAWALHVAVELRHPDDIDKEGIVLKLTKFLTVTFPTSNSDPPPLPIFPISITCDVTGDPELLSDLSSAPPLVVPEPNEHEVRTDRSSERLSAFFGISGRRSKTDSKPHHHIAEARASESDQRDGLFKTMSYYRKKN